MSSIRKTWKSGLIASLAAFFIFSFFSSGCALLWLSAGGAGSYLIKKGEQEPVLELGGAP